MMRSLRRTGSFGPTIGAALLALSSAFAYAELDSLPQGAAEPSIETAENCACQGRQDHFLDRVRACAGCSMASGSNSTNLSVEQLMKYPPCAFRVLTDASNYSGRTAVLWTSVLVIFVAILMEQAISGFRGGLPLAFVLSGVALFSAIFVLKSQLEEGILPYLVLVFLAASFGGALAHWIVYIRDLLPVAALGLGLFGLFYLLNDQNPLPEPVAWVAGASGGVWLYFWRRRRAKSSTARPRSNGTQVEITPTPENRSSKTQ